MPNPQHTAQVRTRLRGTRDGELIGSSLTQSGAQVELCAGQLNVNLSAIVEEFAAKSQRNTDILPKNLANGVFHHVQ